VAPFSVALTRDGGGSLDAYGGRGTVARPQHGRAGVAQGEKGGSSRTRGRWLVCEARRDQLHQSESKRSLL
jgi:hypothetical protein